MPTTANLDDDILLAMRERARRGGRTTGEVLSAELALAASSASGLAGIDPHEHR